CATGRPKTASRVVSRAGRRSPPYCATIGGATVARARVLEATGPTVPHRTVTSLRSPTGLPAGGNRGTVSGAGGGVSSLGALPCPSGGGGGGAAGRVTRGESPTRGGVRP